MKRIFSYLSPFLAVFSVFAMNSGAANAVGICKCDSPKPLPDACHALCIKANKETLFARPAVYFGTDEIVNGDKNPLNQTSLKFLYLSSPTRQGMENFRRFLEKHRKKAEAEFRAMKRAYKRGHVGPEEFVAAEKKRNQALVNYYHGMRAYLTTPSPR